MSKSDRPIDEILRPFWQAQAVVELVRARLDGLHSGEPEVEDEAVRCEQALAVALRQMTDACVDFEGALLAARREETA